MNPPVRLLCVGRGKEIALAFERTLAPHVSFASIITMAEYSPQALQTVMRALNPAPAGVIVGGGISVEAQSQAKQVVDEHNRGGGEAMKLILMPMGIIGREGMEGATRWAKNALSDEFGVTWD